MCVCGGAVQTERHVVEHCPLIRDIKQNYGVKTLVDLFAGNIPHDTTLKIIYEILDMYN